MLFVDVCRITDFLKSFFIIVFLLIVGVAGYGQCSVNAGNDTTICQGKSLVRTVTYSPSNNSTITWYTTSNTTVIHSGATFIIPTNASGTTDYIVKINGPGGCEDKDTFRVIVNPSPSVSAGSNISACQFSSGSISAVASPSNGTVNWYQAGSSVSLATGLTFSYPTVSAGSTDYVVKIDSAGTCFDFDTIRVSINPKPTASFTYSPNSGCPRKKRKISFNSTSSSNGGGNLNYSWNFGDPNSNSNTSNDNNPEHSFIGNGFNSSGTFTVTLIVTSPSGCKDTATESLSFGQFPDATLIDTINEPDFATCNGGNSLDLTVNNASSTQSINTNYQINWGDNSASWTGTSMTYATHTYPAQGYYTLTFIVTASGCKDSTDYRVFFGSNPGGSISSPSSTFGCTGQVFSFPFANVAGNSPGTEYTIVVNDGSDTVRYTQENLPPTFTHTFDSSSCGTAPNNTFTVSYTISNPCGETPGSIGGIRISKKPQADFSISPKDTVCVNSNVTFTSTGSAGQVVPPSGSGACTNGKQSWEITPSTGWTLTTGTLGNSSAASPANWTTGTNSIQVNFTTPGTYQIKYKVGNTSCGIDDTIKTICVNPLPTADFSVVGDSVGCAPFNVSVQSQTNTPTCGRNTYKWTVGYSSTLGCTPSTSNFSFANNTSDTSANPQFTFVNPGVYTVNLQTIAPLAACSSQVVSHQVIVKGKPVVSINLSPTSICQNTSISPTQTSTCYIDANTTYAWTFPNGSPTTSTSATPGSISYSNSGTNNIGLTVTNACGSTPASASVIVNPLPNVTGTLSVCIGQTTTLTGNSTASGSGSWSSSNTSIATVNNSGVVTGVAAGTAIITFTDGNGCQKSVTVTVNPLPTITGNAPICVNGTLTLTGSPTAASINPWVSSNTAVATITSGGVVSALSSGSATITYTNANGCQATVTVVVNALPTISGTTTICLNNTSQLSGSGTASATNPWTSSSPTVASVSNTGLVNALAVGTTDITYTDANGCSKTVTITVKPLPTISGSTQICVGSTVTYSGTGNPAATNPWQSSNTTVATITSGGVVTAVASGTTVITYTDQFGCQATLTVTVSSSPTASISYPLTICTSQTNQAATITGATGGVFSYTTSPGLGSFSSTNGSFNPSTSNPGSYTVNYSLAAANGCPAVNVSTTVAVTATPAAPVASNNGPICSGGTLQLSTGYSGSGTPTWSWTGPNGFTSTDEDPSINNVTTAASGTYNVTVTVNGCTSSAGSTTVVVGQTPATPTAGSNSPVCSGNALTLNASTTSTMLVTWSWSGPNSYSSTNQNPTVSASSTTSMSGTYSVTATATYTTVTPSLVCPSTSATTDVTVYQTPSISSTSSTDPTSCASSTGSITLNGLNASTSYEVHYTGPGGSVTVTIQSNSSGSVVIPNLPAGTYSNIYVVSNNCPAAAVGPISLTDPNPPAAPVASNNGPICSGGTLQLSTGYSGSGTPTWSWTGPNGFTSTDEDPSISNVTTAASGTYNVTVTVNGCTSSAGSTTVVVGQTPATPTAGSNSPVCSGNALTLNASTTSTMLVTWSWSGPNSYSSTNQNPTVSASSTTSMSGTYSVTATATYTTVTPSLVCPSTSATTDVTVYQTPSISSTSSTDPTSCASSTGSITLNGLNASTSYEVHYTGPGGSVTVTIQSNSSGSVVIPNLPAGTYSNIYVVSNNCPAAAVGPISLTDPNPPAAPVASNNGPICSGGTLQLSTGYSGSGTPTWSWTGPNGFTSTDEDPSISNVTTAASGTYNVTVTVNGCTSSAGSTTVVVGQTPATPTAGSNSPVCSGNALTLNASTTSTMLVTWSWSGPNSYSSTNQNPTVSASSTTSMSGTYSVTATATYTTVTPSLVCPSTSATTDVTVYQTPSISSTSSTDPTNCASSTGSITLNGLNASTSYVVHYTGPGGSVTVTIQSNSSGSVVIPNLPAGTYSNIYVVSNNCPAAAVGPISLTDPNPPAAPVCVVNSPICTGESFTITITSPLINGQYEWTGPNGFTQSGGTSVTINNALVVASGNYLVTVTLNSCLSQAGSISVVVNPRPVPPVVSSPINYCQYVTPSPLSATALPGHTLNWYTTSTGGTASSIAPTPSTSQSGITTYYVSQTNPENCEGQRDSIKVIVNPTPVIADTQTTICSGAGFSISPVGTGVLNTTTYSWNSPAGSGTNQPFISGSLSNSTDDPLIITFPVTPFTPNSTGTCQGNDFDIQVTINPAPRVIFSALNDTICSGQQNALVTLSSPTQNALINWTVNYNGVNHTTITPGTLTQLPVETFNNPTTQPILVVYEAVAVTNDLTACPGDTIEYSILVNPTPAIHPDAITVCNRDTIRWVPSSQSPNILPSGTTYTWTVITNNPLISGQRDSLIPHASQFYQVLHNTSNTPQNIIYQITPSVGSGTDACTGTPFNLTVTVNPSPEIPTQFDTICSEQTFIVTPVNNAPTSTTIVPANTTYSWGTPQLPANCTFSGSSTGTNSTNINGTIFNNNTFPVTVIYQVLPISGNCVGDTFEVHVLVNPLASFSNNPPNQAICNGGASLPVNWTSGTTGATYSWTLSYDGSDNQGANTTTLSGPTLPAMTLTNTGVTQDSVVYQITSTASACPGRPAPYTIYVNPDAKADFDFTADTACWPFALPITNISPTTADSAYYWYADGVLIGTGYAFPGYTIPVSDTFVDIKLFVKSRYGCVNDSMTHRFYTWNQPNAEFTATYTLPPCGPNLEVQFTNLTLNNTINLIQNFNYQWNFGNGQTFNGQNPPNIFFASNPNFTDTTYIVELMAFNVCDTSRDTVLITVQSPPKAQFAPDATNICSNTQVVFTNTSLGIGNTYQWNFGDGSTLVNMSTADTVQHLYNVGTDTTFLVILTATNQCGVSADTVSIRVTPSTIDLNWLIIDSTQFGCAPHQVRVRNVSTGGTNFTWNFGDGSPVYNSNSNQETFYHTYNTPGIYTITVQASNGCTDTSGTKQVRVIRTPIPQFQIVNDNVCPWSTVQFTNQTDTATSFLWTFGDPGSGIRDTSRLPNPSHVYNQPGVYTVTLTAILTDNTSAVSCPAVTQQQVHIVAPDIQIAVDSPACVRDTISFLPIVNSPIGLAPIRDTAWFINGVAYPVPPRTYPRFSHVFAQPGVYTISLVVGTVNGCRDTASIRITVNQIPTISASTDQRICQGNSVQLNANSNAGNYQWDPSPNSGLSCYTCSNPVASPTTSTVYIVSTISIAGCRNRDTVKVIVIPPFQMDVQPLVDTICQGESVQLIANGAANYVWSPAYSLSCSRCNNPVATPPVTTLYTVVGSDGYNCFTDTARIRVTVGRYPVITLVNPPTQHTGDSVLLQPQITNGPIRNYEWTPDIDLSCDNCSTPKAYVRRDRCYTLTAENIYGCSDTAMVCVTAFCENAQVFIPNAFTPGSSDINDRFYIQGRGFMIKHLRVFNRWGEVVFEASNVNPNDRSLDRAAWSGKVRGVMSTSDVFVYMAEVMCDNGTTFTYKGNVTLIR